MPYLIALGPLVLLSAGIVLKVLHDLRAGPSPCEAGTPRAGEASPSLASPALPACAFAYIECSIPEGMTAQQWLRRESTWGRGF